MSFLQFKHTKSLLNAIINHFKINYQNQGLCNKNCSNNQLLLQLNFRLSLATINVIVTYYKLCFNFIDLEILQCLIQFLITLYFTKSQLERVCTSCKRALFNVSKDLVHCFIRGPGPECHYKNSFGNSLIINTVYLLQIIANNRIMVLFEVCKTNLFSFMF